MDTFLIIAVVFGCGVCVGVIAGAIFTLHGSIRDREDFDGGFQANYPPPARTPHLVRPRQERGRGMSAFFAGVVFGALLVGSAFTVFLTRVRRDHPPLERWDDPFEEPEAVPVRTIQSINRKREINL